MKKYLMLVTAVLVASWTLAPLTKVYAFGEAEKAVVVTAEDAAKKYPLPPGKDYPPGINANTHSATASGFVQSPYSARIYDCRHMGHGTLILDEGAKKLFRKP
ncbi:MAG TPA: hypothetical protein VJ281_04965 [Chthoniobacterales bacterium]|jgi:hypothetical protein|nr:hypothetical protein [Chthoniobacterales bacterium]